MSRECISIHIGQAGCQIGLSCWELMCLEHNIKPDGMHAGLEGTATGDTGDASAFFSETSHGQFVPRAIFVDTDPTTRDEIFAGQFGRLFHPDDVLGYKQDCKGNYFEGRSMADQFRMREDIADRIRLAVDLSNNLQGFFVFHSFGGGTGSGLGARVLSDLKDQFDKKLTIQPLLFPSAQLSSLIVEPYNCMFATKETRDTVDFTIMMDNEASYRLCQRGLDVPYPDFMHVNRLIAQVVSGLTTNMRYESALNASLKDIVTALVPQKEQRYGIVSISPIRPPGRESHETCSTAEIVTELFEARTFMSDCTEYLKTNRYLCACVLLRGKEAAPVDSKDLTATGFPKENPIEANGALAAVNAMSNPKSAHRSAVRFPPWMSNGFKVGVVGQEPCSPAGFMAPTKRQGVMIGNTTAVRQLFVRQYAKFLKLFFSQGLRLAVSGIKRGDRHVRRGQG